MVMGKLKVQTIICIMLTKLVNKKWNDRDEHLNIVLYAYCMTYKVTMGHTPFQLVYGLRPYMPT